MTAHTPGLWFPCHNRDTGSVFIDGVDGYSVAHVSALARPLDEQLANARLIASAPNLLEVCQQILDLAGRAGWNIPDYLTNMALSAVTRATQEA